MLTLILTFVLMPVLVFLELTITTVGVQEFC